MLIIYWEHDDHWSRKQTKSDEKPSKILGMRPFQEKWTRLLNETLLPSPLKSTETVQRSCVTVNVIRGAAHTLTGEDNVAEPSSSFQLCSHGAAEAPGVTWQFSGGGEKRSGWGGFEVKRQRDKVNVSICWEPGSLLSETSTCLLRVLWWGS